MGTIKRLADDTPLDVEARQIEGWRRMTAAEKADTVAALSRGVRDLALAGAAGKRPIGSGATSSGSFARKASCSIAIA